MFGVVLLSSCLVGEAFIGPGRSIHRLSLSSSSSSKSSNPRSLSGSVRPCKQYQRGQRSWISDGRRGATASLSTLSLLADREHESSTDPLITRINTWTKPIQGVLDESTGGWALSYADLAPDSPSTPGGKAFLATNIFYLVAGLLLTWEGDPLLGFIIDITAIASFNYHYNQLVATNETLAKSQIQPVVKLSLLLDYAAASLSIGTALVYIFTDVTWNEEVRQAIEASLLGVVFLGVGWKYEEGRPYMIFHSLWHIFSAYAGYLIGTAHLHIVLGAASGG